MFGVLQFNHFCLACNKKETHIWVVHVQYINFDDCGIVGPEQFLKLNIQCTGYSEIYMQLQVLLDHQPQLLV